MNKSLFWLIEWKRWWGANNRATWQRPGAWHPANRDQKTGGEQTTGQTADEGRHLKRAVHAGDKESGDRYKFRLSTHLHFWLIFDSRKKVIFCLIIIPVLDWFIRN